MSDFERKIAKQKSKANQSKAAKANMAEYNKAKAKEKADLNREKEEMVTSESE